MEFEVLGPLRVREGTEQIPLTAQMSRTLLGILLTRAGTPVPVDVLVDALWGRPVRRQCAQEAAAARAPAAPRPR